MFSKKKKKNVSECLSYFLPGLLQKSCPNFLRQFRPEFPARISVQRSRDSIQTSLSISISSLSENSVRSYFRNSIRNFSGNSIWSFFFLNPPELRTELFREFLPGYFHELLMFRPEFLSEFRPELLKKFPPEFHLDSCQKCFLAVLQEFFERVC